MRITYTDQNGAGSERTIWPIMLGFVESRRFIVGWCELRQDYRLFRADPSRTSPSWTIATPATAVSLSRNGGPRKNFDARDGSSPHVPRSPENGAGIA
ncbi:hypothetical protein PZN02_004710 [Sinorhizobium garamanticum]|uniref:WYL domain-containing protein n=1 Tax=Sinorhizobium garamanticum TaxID=680247 RepID=A0ABY8DK36_9HYPH|nr:WYL domain-containing protein [Sinorhizobium garamanticum]WEX91281.1 hypothetical protein PZN02_004710 [Sinorhizobium garamanticum]